MAERLTGRYGAYRLSDGDAAWFVRGTDDPDEALRILLKEYPEAEEEAPVGTDDGIDYELAPDVERVGWFRFNPCNCGDHGWHLGYADGPGRGRFLGVYLSVGLRPVEYEGDLDLFLGLDQFGTKGVSS